MPASAQSVFDDPKDFHAAQLENGILEFVVTGREKFWARLARISLYRTRLLSCEEHQARIAFISLPPGMVRVTLPREPDASLMWAGIGARRGELVTRSGGHRFHERTDGPCLWSTLWLLTSELDEIGRAMTDDKFIIPAGERRWRPKPGKLRSLTSLHAGAIRATAARIKLPVEKNAARGLEQQLILALIECLADAATDYEGPPDPRHSDIMVRFEDMLGAAPLEARSVDEIARALDISRSILQAACRAHLGMSPSRYLYLRRMGLVHRALRDPDRTEATVAQIARLHGFNVPDDFEVRYHELFDEAPFSALLDRTLR